MERLRREQELRLRSQSLQRSLPRPATMNETVLRPFNVDPPLNGTWGTLRDFFMFCTLSRVDTARVIIIFFQSSSRPAARGRAHQARDVDYDAL